MSFKILLSFNILLGILKSALFMNLLYKFVGVIFICLHRDISSN